MVPPDLGPLGAPPHDFDSRELVLTSWSASLYRVHRVGHHALHFGKSGHHRFDDPKRAFGVLYASTDLAGGFSETFAGVSSLSMNSLTVSGWSVIEPHRGLRLCDLRDHGLARIGADGRLCTGNRQDAQLWSQAIWAHPSTVDGICYPARTNLAKTSVAVFDRARAVLDARDQGTFTDPKNVVTTASMLDRYGIALIPG